MIKNKCGCRDFWARCNHGYMATPENPGLSLIASFKVTFFGAAFFGEQGVIDHHLRTGRKMLGKAMSYQARLQPHMGGGQPPVCLPEADEHIICKANACPIRPNPHTWKIGHFIIKLGKL